MNNEIDAKAIGQRIKEARKAKHLTQHDVYLKTQISLTQLSAYENGRRNIGLTSLANIAEALNVSVDELYFGRLENRPISKALNKGELIVNCVDALVKENIIVLVPEELDTPYLSTGFEHRLNLGFGSYIDIIYDLVKKLVDFEANKDLCKEPDDFKKQLLDMAVNKINRLP